MHEFIHTFSGITYLTAQQFTQMHQYYHEEFIHSGEKGKWLFTAYTERGLRMTVQYATEKEKQYKKKHGSFRAEWIVTPAKLIYSGQTMMKLYTPYEYTEACRQLQNIADEIKTSCGVDLLEEAKLKRIDLTKDIVTPSEEYSHEVIRLAKLALSKYGYHLWSAEELETRKEEWKDENAVFFYNHNQELEAKMYNKKADLILQGYDTADIPSIIRFELTLKRKFMKSQGWIREEYVTPKELPVVLTTALARAPDLMRQHITDPLWSGETLSKDRQKKEFAAIAKARQRNIRK